MPTVTDAVYQMAGYNPSFGSYYDYRTMVFVVLIVYIIGLTIASVAAYAIFKYYIFYWFKSAISSLRGKW